MGFDALQEKGLLSFYHIETGCEIMESGGSINMATQHIIV
jgi:hypothetical protein